MDLRDRILSCFVEQSNEPLEALGDFTVTENQIVLGDSFPHRISDAKEMMKTIDHQFEIVSA